MPEAKTTCPYVCIYIYIYAYTHIHSPTNCYPLQPPLLSEGSLGKLLRRDEPSEHLPASRLYECGQFSNVGSLLVSLVYKGAVLYWGFKKGA